MCFVLYMASDRERREIAWDENDRHFHVKANDVDAQRARSQFSKNSVHYLGSGDGCGCAFRRDPDWVFAQENEDRRHEIEDNQRRLHEYLSECLVDEDEIELFGCWSGDEEIPAEKSRTILVDDLVTKEFFFEEREKIVVRKRTWPG